MSEMLVEKGTELTSDLVLPVKLLCEQPVSVVMLRAAFVTPAGVSYADIGRFAVRRSHSGVNINNVITGYTSKWAHLVKEMIKLNMWVAIVGMPSHARGPAPKIFQITSIGRRALWLYDNTGVTLDDLPET